MKEWKIPVKTAWMKEQSKHEPSMAYAKNIYDTCRMLMSGFTALEIGAAWGFSALAILEAGAKHLTSVDPNTSAEAHNEAVANGYGDKHEWNCVHSHDYWRENQTLFDLIYVDGSHIYDSVREDLEEAWKRVKPHGLLLLDDWDHPKNNIAEGDRAEYGVSLAAFQFWQQHEEEIFSEGINGRVLWFSKC